MSTFAEKKALKVKHAAAVKKHGAKSQAAGRIQYQLNNLSSNPKGNAVTTSNGKAVTTAKGTVRTKPNPNRTTGKRIISKGIARPTKTGGHPSAGRPTVQTTGLGGKTKTVAAGSGKVIDAKQPKSDRGLEKPKPTRLATRQGKGHPSAERFAYVNNIGKKASVLKTAPVTKKVKETVSKLHPYAKLATSRLELKAKSGDKRAIAILKIRNGK